MEGASGEGFADVVGEDTVYKGVSGELLGEEGERTTTAYVEDFVGGLGIEPSDDLCG